MGKILALFIFCTLFVAPVGAVPVTLKADVTRSHAEKNKTDVSSFDTNTIKKCMLELPETIELAGLKEPLVKVKDRLVDHEAAQKGMGYSQNYQNAVCWATVYIYDLTEKQITKAIIEADFLRNLQEIKYVFDKVHKKTLKQFHSYEIPMLDTKYFANIAFTDTSTEALMEGDFNNYILKGRATCHQVEGVKADVNANIALKHLDELIRASAKQLNTCLK